MRLGLAAGKRVVRGHCMLARCHMLLCSWGLGRLGAHCMRMFGPMGRAKLQLVYWALIHLAFQALSNLWPPRLWSAGAHRQWPVPARPCCRAYSSRGGRDSHLPQPQGWCKDLWAAVRPERCPYMHDGQDPTPCTPPDAAGLSLTGALCSISLSLAPPSAALAPPGPHRPHLYPPCAALPGGVRPGACALLRSFGGQ